MAEGKSQSLGELETTYQEKIRHWDAKRAQLVAQLDECDRHLRAYEEKLHWVQTLIVNPHGAAPLPPAPGGKKRRKRKSPVKLVTYQALKNRPGQWLTARQIMTAVRKDSNKRPSRQAINVNLNLLEREKKIQRRPAPRGKSGGAHYVYSAL